MEEPAAYDTSFVTAARRRVLAAFQRTRSVSAKSGSPSSPAAVIAVECVEDALVQFSARREATTDAFSESDLRVFALALLHLAEHLMVGCDECAPHAPVDMIVTVAQRAQQLAALYRAEQRLLLEPGDER